MDGFTASEQRGSGVRAPSRPDPSSALVIRLAREDELADVAALFGPAIEGYRAINDDPLIGAYLYELVTGVRERWEVGDTYVAVSDRRVVGSVAFYRDVALEGWSTLPAGWTGFRALVVDPAARGAGIGSALVEHCLVRSRKIGAAVLGIHTADFLSHAVRLYHAMGFVRCPEYDLAADRIFPVEGSHVTAIAFRYDLTAEPMGPRTVIEPGSTT